MYKKTFQTESKFWSRIMKSSFAWCTVLGIVIPEDTEVFKTFWGRLKKIATSYNQTRRRQDVWKRTSNLQCLEEVLFTSSWRCPIYIVLKTFDLRRLVDVWFTTSWRRQIYVVLKVSNLRLLQDFWFTTSWGRLISDVLKTSDLHRLQDVYKTASM